MDKLKAAGPARFSRRVVVIRHGLKGWFLRPGWFTRFVLAVNNLALVAGPLIAAGWKFSAGYTAWWAVTGLVKAYRDLSPARLKELQRSNYERNLIFYEVIQKLQRHHRNHPERADLDEFQKLVLRLIASYARDHRGDTTGGQVFASLLVEQGPDMIVVARDSSARVSPGRAPKETTLAYKSLQTQQPQTMGDLYIEWPKTPPGKPYRSVLAIPVKLQSSVVGVVTIDSSQAYHFDGQDEDIVKELYPFVALLAWTLDSEHHSAVGRAGKADDLDTVAKSEERS